MKLLLHRRFKGPEYTIGTLSVNGSRFCDTLEDKDRGLDHWMSEAEVRRQKVYGKTAIPTGTYHIDMSTTSPKFMGRIWAKPWDGKLPRLLSVTGFAGVLIHVGNTAADTDGCVLVGRNTIKGQLTQSSDTFARLMKLMVAEAKKGEDITITIE